MIKIFVSHSSHDEALAEELVNCLMSSVELKDTEIRCTSVPGHKLPLGSDTVTTIRNELGVTSIVIGLITRNSVSSGWVLFEMGAAWGAGTSLKPLLSDDIDFKDLPGPLSGKHAAKLASKGDMTQLVDEVVDITKSAKRTGAKVDAAIDALIRAHAEHLKAGAKGGKGKPSAKAAAEPVFAGIPYSELVEILHKEMVKVPAGFFGLKVEGEYSLLTMLETVQVPIAHGIQSNAKADGIDWFVYHRVLLPIMKYGLVQFDKLPASQAKFFKRISLSESGRQFLAHRSRYK
jgi:hypothetical protein